MQGWCGKILRVDLSKGKIAAEPLDPKVARDYIGARGFGIYYLRKEVDPRCDPLGPKTKSSWRPGRSPARRRRPAPAMS